MGHVGSSPAGEDGGRLKAIAFRCANRPLGQMLLKSAGLPLHIAGQIRVDRWQGRESVQMIVDDAAGVN